MDSVDFIGILQGMRFWAAFSSSSWSKGCFFLGGAVETKSVKDHLQLQNWYCSLQLFVFCQLTLTTNGWDEDELWHCQKAGTWVCTDFCHYWSLIRLKRLWFWCEGGSVAEHWQGRRGRWGGGAGVQTLCFPTPLRSTGDWGCQEHSIS